MNHANTIRATSIRRPDWISRNVCQKVVLVRDDSPSMAGRKAKDATAASIKLLEELAAPVNKDGFFVAVIDFAGAARVANSFERATVLTGKLSELAGRSGGGTNITEAVEKALDLLRSAGAVGEAGVAFLQPVTLLFSDGEANTGGSPVSAASELRQFSDLVTVAFGDDADEVLLREIATSPQHFYRCKDGRELRQFLAEVGKTLTATRGAGVNATQSLSSISQ